MGHTGEGLNQARAHVHLELNLMLSRQFEAWHEASFKNEPNHHGLYNGLNLVGIDIDVWPAHQLENAAVLAFIRELNGSTVLAVNNLFRETFWNDGKPILLDRL